MSKFDFTQRIAKVLSLSMLGGICLSALLVNPTKAQTTNRGCYNLGNEKAVLFALPIRSEWTYDLRQNPDAIYKFVDNEISRLGYSPRTCQITEQSGSNLRRYTMNNFAKNPSNSFVVGWSSTRGSFGFIVISACDNTYKNRSGYCVGGPGQAYDLVKNSQSWETRWRNDGTNGYSIRAYFLNPKNTQGYSASDILYSIQIE
jgi:hypothetical protein